MKKITSNQLKNLIYKGANNPNNQVGLGAILKFENLEISGAFYGLSFEKIKKGYGIYKLVFTNCVFRTSLNIKQSAQGTILQFVSIEKCKFTKKIYFGGTGLMVNINYISTNNNIEAYAVTSISLDNITAKSISINRGYENNNHMSLYFGKMNIEEIRTSRLAEGKGVSVNSCHVSMLPIITSLLPNQPIGHIYTDKNQKIVAF